MHKRTTVVTPNSHMICIYLIIFAMNGICYMNLDLGNNKNLVISNVLTIFLYVNEFASHHVCLYLPDFSLDIFTHAYPSIHHTYLLFYYRFVLFNSSWPYVVHCFFLFHARRKINILVNLYENYFRFGYFYYYVLRIPFKFPILCRR